MFGYTDITGDIRIKFREGQNRFSASDDSFSKIKTLGYDALEIIYKGKEGQIIEKTIYKGDN